MKRAVSSIVLLIGYCAAAPGDVAIQIIQVCDDAGADCTDLGLNDSNIAAPNDYVYESQMQTIWDQVPAVGTLNFSYTTWNNTAAQQLTSAERTALYGAAWTGGTQPPTAPANTLQIFFVKDHPGTCTIAGCYDGSAGKGWEANPLANPNFSARNAGNAQLGLTGFSTNGRAVMANNGFASDQLAGTLAHEIGHLLGLRHINDDAAAGTTTDPNVTLEDNVANLMWSGGEGPDFDNNLSLVENFPLSAAQKTAVVLNGTAQGFITAVPEPSAFLFMGLASLLAVARKKRLLR